MGYLPPVASCGVRTPQQQLQYPYFGFLESRKDDVIISLFYLLETVVFPASVLSIPDLQVLDFCRGDFLFDLRSVDCEGEPQWRLRLGYA